MDKFKTVLDLWLKNRNTLSYVLVTLLTAGSEKIFSAVVFQCPCSAFWNLPYGLVFLLVPALALFLLGCVLSARTWRLLTGCCEPKARAHCSSSHGARACIQLLGVAALAPLTWIAMGLLGGSFYECAVSGSSFMAQRLCEGQNASCIRELPRVPCQQSKSRMQDLLRELKAQSQVLGWVLIAIVIISLLLCTSIVRCLSPVSFMQLKFWEIYSEKERQIWKNEASEHATELATDNVKCFFKGAQPKNHSTPSNMDWQQISALYTFKPEEQFYSVLHKHVNKKEKNDSHDCTEGKIAAVLDFVDDAV